MKRNLLIILIVGMFANIPALAQYDPNYDSDERLAKTYSRKIVTFSKMKRTGVGLGIGGAVLTVAGVALISSADWETTQAYNGGSQKTTNDSEGVVGALMVVAGVPLAITGIVLGIIGSNKIRSYQQKLHGLSINMRYTPQEQGITFAYRF